MAYDILFLNFKRKGEAMKIICNENTKRREIIKAIRHVMLDRDIKNAQVMDKLGSTKQTVSNTLNPDYRPDSSMTIDTLVTLCQAIGCQLVIDIVPIDDNQIKEK